MKTFESKEGDGGSKLSLDDVCKGFKKLYDVIDETLPEESRKVGLG